VRIATILIKDLPRLSGFKQQQDGDAGYFSTMTPLLALQRNSGYPANFTLPCPQRIPCIEASEAAAKLTVAHKHLAPAA